MHEEELLSLAAAAEEGSEHPLAEAVVSGARGKGITWARAEAFEAVMAAWRADPSERDQAVQDATRGAIAVPLRVMEVSVASFEVLEAMARTGLQASLSDAGVGALCARTAVMSAELNVRINASGITDADERRSLLGQASELRETALRREREVLALVDEKLE